eukprot:GEMP01014365.1.p1 GENE.GEMP01014365.1~~GEMP01014365.1.p1  ORF type:complete len:483 (+),score=118.63 GEMP01014365.1:38-1486(+)
MDFSWKFHNVTNLKSIFEALQDYALDAIMTVRPEGVFVESVDEDSISLFRLKWKKDAFLEYKCTTPYTFMFMPIQVVKVLNLADSNDAVTVSIKADSGMFLDFRYTQQIKGKFGARECSYVIPITEPSQPDSLDFPKYTEMRAEAIVPCSLWEDQIQEIAHFTASLKLTVSTGAIHFESDSDHVLHRILYSPATYTSAEEQQNCDGRQLAYEDAIKKEHRVMDDIHQALKAAIPEIPDTKDAKLDLEAARDAYWERNPAQFERKVKRKVREDIEREQRSKEKRKAKECVKAAAEELGFSDVQIAAEEGTTEDVKMEDVKDKETTKESDEITNEEGTGVEPGTSAAMEEDTVDWESPSIVSKLKKVAEVEFRRVISGIIEPKLAEHTHNKDIIRQKCVHAEDVLAGSQADGQAHMSLRIHHCGATIEHTFNGAKLKQMAVRAPNFAKMFTLKVQQHMPLCMEMELWGPNNGTIELFLAPKAEE